MGRGWIQDIKDMVKIEKEAMNMPWVKARSAQAGPTPGVLFFTAGGVPMQPPKLKPANLILPLHEPELPTYNGVTDEAPSEVVFELDGWRIERYKEAGMNEVDWMSHYCPSYGWRYNTDMWNIMADGICACCCELIPEELIGVWKLKNFDSLPSEEIARTVLSGQDMGHPYP